MIFEGEKGEGGFEEWRKVPVSFVSSKTDKSHILKGNIHFCKKYFA